MRNQEIYLYKKLERLILIFAKKTLKENGLESIAL